jgi:hypothetical protein
MESTNMNNTSGMTNSEGGMGMGGQQGGMMGNTNTSTTGGGGDFLDKGVDFLERKAGHEQVRCMMNNPLLFDVDSHLFL